MNITNSFDARSLLCIPADAERFFVKAADRGADLIVLDLEDGVAPAVKARARAALLALVEALHGKGALVYVRVNNEPALLSQDVQAAVYSGADGIVMPKVEAPEELAQLDADMKIHECAAGREPSSMRLIALIETPQGVNRAADIARASPRLVSMGLGAEDFSAAMEIAPTVEALRYPTQAVAIAAVAAGLHPIGLPGPVGDFSDLAAYRVVAEQALTIGNRGAICIHPAQVGVLNDVFGGSEAQVAAAERVVAAFDAALAMGKGAIALEGRMIDAPIANRARLLLARSQSRTKQSAASASDIALPVAAV